MVIKTIKPKVAILLQSRKPRMSRDQVLGYRFEGLMLGLGYGPALAGELLVAS